MAEDTVLQTSRPADPATPEPAGRVGGSGVLVEPAAVAQNHAGVRFKGWRGGLLIEVPASGEWDEVVAELAGKLGLARDFWEGAPATLDLGDREVEPAGLEALLERLQGDFGVEPVGVVSAVESVRETAAGRELETYPELPPAPPKPERPDPRSETRYLKGTVRSGVVVEAPGNLVVVGDVNAGAEVRAGRDILVMGTLRGVAHAGFGGDLGAEILAINLRPTQLRIGSLIARAPDGGQPPLSKFPEKALVENGEIHVRPL